MRGDYIIIQDVYFATEMSILLCHIALSYFVTLFVMLYFVLFYEKTHYYYTVYFVIHARISLC